MSSTAHIARQLWARTQAIAAAALAAAAAALAAACLAASLRRLLRWCLLLLPAWLVAAAGAGVPDLWSGGAAAAGGAGGSWSPLGSQAGGAAVLFQGVCPTSLVTF